MDKFLELLNKVVRDEISAYIFYINCANSAIGLGIKPIVNELIEHAKEELEHYHKIITYCNEYNLQDKIQICLDESIVNIYLTDINEIVSKVQELEHQAILDYNCLIKLCKEINDEKGLKLFREILNDEYDHFNELSYVHGDNLELFPCDNIESENAGIDGLLNNSHLFEALKKINIAPAQGTLSIQIEN